MIKISVSFFLVLLIMSCEHSDYDITKFTGDYRYYAGIAEFYDCDSQIKYYVADAGINTELEDMYATLNYNKKEDVYIRVEGYLKEEKQMDGVDPMVVFVAVKLLDHDTNRGCKRGIRQGL